MGIATRLLGRVCADAQAEGYEFVEAYPTEGDRERGPAFTGPVRLYEKAGFRIFSRRGAALVMRKPLKG